MALRQMIKFTKNIADLCKDISNLGDEHLYGEWQRSVGKAVVERLEYGIDNSITIEGGRIAGIKDSTRERRAQKNQNPDNPPLHGTGALRNNIQYSIPNHMTIELQESSEYEEYGQYHNEGFEQTNPKQWHYGATVQKRKWWGIPKTWRPTGTAYKLAMNDLAWKMKALFGTYVRGLKGGKPDPFLPIGKGSPFNFNVDRLK